MLKNNFKNSLIKSFYDKFSDFSDTKNYLFIGKISEWDNDNSPPQVKDSLEEELEAWQNMLICKRITPNEVVFVIRRINWETGKVYQQYDDTLELYSDTTLLDFYVFTPENNVYKCISNNNGSVSQYSPTGTSTEEIVTQDGYIWKYMYSVRPELIDFITEEYIPVEFLDELSYTDQRSFQLIVEQDAKSNKNGSISNIIVTQIGSSYPYAIDYLLSGEMPPETSHLVQQNVSIGGTSIRFNTNSNISRINDVYNNYVVYIYSGPGSGQVRTITDYNGDTCVATIDSSEPFTEAITTSSYYKILPKVEIIGGGTGAVAISVVNPLTKQIDSISVLNGGTGYKEASVEIKTNKTDEIQKTKARVVISPFNGHGSSPLIELGCKNMMIKTIFDKESIQSLNFYNDYRQVGLIQNITAIGEQAFSQTYTFDIENINSSTVIDYSGSGQTLVQFENLIYLYINDSNWIVKQGSDDSASQAQGFITSINTTNKTINLRTVNGKFMNYPDSTVYPLVLENIIDGTEITFTAITVVNTAPLNYYSDVTFNINDVILGKDSKATGIVTNWKPTFFGTDGKLTIKNIKGSFIESYYNDNGDLVNGENIIGFSDINTTSGIVGFAQEKVGIIKNVQRTEVLQGKDTFRATTVLTIERPVGVVTPFTSSDFPNDTRIKQGTTNATALVVGWNVSPDGTTGTLILTDVNGTFLINTSSGYRIQKLISGVYTTQETQISSISIPEVTRYSGKIIYIENIRPVVRGDDQTEEIKIIIGL